VKIANKEDDLFLLLIAAHPAAPGHHKSFQPWSVTGKSDLALLPESVLEIPGMGGEAEVCEEDQPHRKYAGAGNGRTG
jgi:hypothetical protein